MKNYFLNISLRSVLLKKLIKITSNWYQFFVNVFFKGLFCSNMVFLLYMQFYSSESHVLQYFSNVRLHSTALDYFAEVVKVTDHISLWNAELARWLLTGIKDRFRIHAFRPSWPCLIAVEDLSTQGKVVEKSGYYAVINCFVTLVRKINYVVEKGS